MKVEQLKMESSITPESLTSHIRSVSEFNESLSLYLKQYCEESKKELEVELSHIKAEYNTKLEEFAQIATSNSLQEQERQRLFHSKEVAYQSQIAIYQNDISRLETQFKEERTELEQLNTDLLAQLNCQATEDRSKHDSLQLQILQMEQ